MGKKWKAMREFDSVLWNKMSAIEKDSDALAITSEINDPNDKPFKHRLNVTNGEMVTLDVEWKEHPRVL